jgi:hypothetical protein
MILKGSTLDVSSNGLTITSCSNDDMPIQEQTTNYTVPSTHTFERKQHYSGLFRTKQSLTNARGNGKYNQNCCTNGTEVNQSVLTQMYSNSNNAFRIPP